MSEKRVRKKHQAQPRPHPVALPERDKLALTSEQASVILVIGLLFGLGVIFEWGWINGFSRLAKSGWPWQDLGTILMGLALLAPFLLIAAVLWGADRDTPRIPLWFWLTALVLANFCLQLFSVLADPRGAERIAQIVIVGERYILLQRCAAHSPARRIACRTSIAPPCTGTPPRTLRALLFSTTFSRGSFGPQLGALLGGCSVGLIAESRNCRHVRLRRIMDSKTGVFVCWPLPSTRCCPG